MTSSICLDTYILASANGVITSAPSSISTKDGSSTESQKDKRNLFATIIKPQMVILQALGMGENNFTSKLGRYLYNFYFLCVLFFCGWISYNAYLSAVIKALLAGQASNVIDQYAWWCGYFVWIYDFVTVLIFYIWALKWKKLRRVLDLLDDKQIEQLYDSEGHEYLQKTKLRLGLKCNIVAALFILVPLLWLALYFYRNGVNFSSIVYSFSALPFIFVNLSLALAFSFYVSIASLWNIFNVALRNEGRLAAESETPALQLEKLVEKYSHLFDTISDLTAMTAGIFRYYAIIHIITFITFINLVYQTMYDPTVWIGFVVQGWFDVILQFVPLCAAVTVSNNSSETVRTIHDVYRRCSRQRHETSNQPSPTYVYFYQRVANEKSCVSLDVAGFIALTKTTLAACFFAAINWCAVIMQFRQGGGTNAGHGVNATVYR